jgi:transcriptional regulator with XRE-family HTH domain
MPKGVNQHFRPRLLLRIRRKERGLSQSELAERLGIGMQSQIAKWETGHTTPSWDNMAAIAKVLGLETLGELLDPASRFDGDNEQP